MSADSCCSHIFMIPLPIPNQSKIVIAVLADVSHALQLSKVEHDVMIDADWSEARAKRRAVGGWVRCLVVPV